MKALPGHLLVISAHSALQYSADTAYPFRQDSNFWYLCGINEPDLLLVIDTDAGDVALLFPDLNDYQKEWDGIPNNDKLKLTSGINSFLQRSDLRKKVKKAMKARLTIGYLAPAPKRIEPYGFYANPARRILEEELLDFGVEKDSLADIRLSIARLRQIKQPVELEAIQTAIDITADTMAEIKANLRSFQTEKDVERALSAGFLLRGGDGHSFSSIVASGKNAATIHYEKNSSHIATDSLLLIDIGINYRGYASDIARAWSIGTLSERQKDIYQATLELQNKAFNMIKPGINLREYQEAMDLEADKVFKKLKCSMAGKKFPHGFSHFLGLDAHDAGDYDAPLAEGSVITVEPGIYLPDEGIGVRVEDDVLITRNGIKNLSVNIPRTL